MSYKQQKLPFAHMNLLHGISNRSNINFFTKFYTEIQVLLRFFISKGLILRAKSQRLPPRCHSAPVKGHLPAWTFTEKKKNAHCVSKQAHKIRRTGSKIGSKSITPRSLRSGHRKDKTLPPPPPVVVVAPVPPAAVSASPASALGGRARAARVCGPRARLRRRAPRAGGGERHGAVGQRRGWWWWWWWTGRARGSMPRRELAGGGGGGGEALPACGGGGASRRPSLAGGGREGEADGRGFVVGSGQRGVDRAEEKKCKTGLGGGWCAAWASGCEMGCFGRAQAVVSRFHDYSIRLKIYIYVDEIYSLRLIKNNLVSDVTHFNTTNDKCMSRFNFFRRREYFPVLWTNLEIFSSTINWIGNISYILRRRK